jgi:hypothetical protein
VVVAPPGEGLSVDPALNRFGAWAGGVGRSRLQCPCHIRSCRLRGVQRLPGVRRFCLSLFHSSIDELLALSHRVDHSAARLIGCIHAR